MAETADTGYTRAEKIAGIVGLILFVALAAVALDLATGGRLTAPRKKPCGCGENEAADAGS